MMHLGLSPGLPDRQSANRARALQNAAMQQNLANAQALRGYHNMSFLGPSWVDLSDTANPKPKPKIRVKLVAHELPFFLDRRWIEETLGPPEQLAPNALLRMLGFASAAA